MTGVRVPEGFRLERLHRDHPRKQFRSGEERVDSCCEVALPAGWI